MYVILSFYYSVGTMPFMYELSTEAWWCLRYIKPNFIILKLVINFKLDIGRNKRSDWSEVFSLSSGHVLMGESTSLSSSFSSSLSLSTLSFGPMIVLSLISHRSGLNNKHVVPSRGYYRFFPFLTVTTVLTECATTNPRLLRVELARKLTLSGIQ